jgi:hypothetical protein
LNASLRRRIVWPQTLENTPRSFVLLRVAIHDQRIRHTLTGADMQHRVPPLPTTQRIHQTAELISRKATDIERWSKIENLATQWDSRAAMAAEWIPDNIRVLDIGCGAMALEKALKNGCQYFPCDVVARRPDCIVADLNRGEFPLEQYDWVTFLGVLEYIHDIDWPVRRAAKIAPNMIVTYCTFVGEDVSDRRGLGWVNDLRYDEFKTLLQQCGWRILREREVKRGYSNIQIMFACELSA